MAGDTITYDYGVIEECVLMMTKKAGEIEAQTDGLRDDVKLIMADWQGATAERYDQVAMDLHNDLQQNKANLDNLNKTLQHAAEEMQQQDRASAGQVG
ncbi:WXG100 family type VII secretion target [Amycolatopsis sp. lyj-109]|uniref:WXG100 family type VII secretion target n=1 Tax=Amycolatopsis sp. lyj-109 TaxID=2789287 RepID=UPI00397C3654